MNAVDIGLYIICRVGGDIETRTNTRTRMIETVSFKTKKAAVNYAKRKMNEARVRYRYLYEYRILKVDASLTWEVPGIKVEED